MHIHKLNKFISTVFLCVLVVMFVTSCSQTSNSPAWPDITYQTKPWTRWWWMGNIVNKNDLTKAMETYKQAGLGGLEITPIYGVKGYEDKFIKYLSQQWVQMLLHTLKEAERLDLGVDMATGTGWPFGGPWVDADDASRYIAHKVYSLKPGQGISEQLIITQSPLVRAVGHRVDINDLKEPVAANPNLQELALDQVRFEKKLYPQTIMAYPEDGLVDDITNYLGGDYRMDGAVYKVNCDLFVLFIGWHGKMVERAAPGGEGYVIDHFSGKAVENYLSRFDGAFAQQDIGGLRAFFNDSYEVDDAAGQADWTLNFLNDFLRLRGYDLRSHLKDLFAGGDTETSRRILCDYQETISDLLLTEFTERWDKWAASKKAVTRNQAHGSPANILDLYAASGIPETEGHDLLGIKMASSAANVTGKQLTSSETATWQDEHFLATLGDVKKTVDQFFIGGVNHIVYHGTTFSPQDETWPGWMFYASVHFGPTNSLWKDFPILNNYVSRCQSFLQNSQTDNDILLYFPYYDLVSQPGREMLHHVGSNISRLPLPNFLAACRLLIDKGYTLDYISDRQIKNLQYSDGILHSGPSGYKVIVIPECNFLPAQTFEKIIGLAEQGATIVILNKLPEDVPGFYELEKQREMLDSLKNRLQFSEINDSQVKQAQIGQGMVYIGTDLDQVLARAQVEREAMVDKGLHFIRKKYKNDKIYFVNNAGDELIDDWIPINGNFVSAAIFNPMKNNFGKAEVRESNDGKEVYIQLYPGQSCIIQTFMNSVTSSPYPYFEMSDEEQEIDGTWTITFNESGPALPGIITTSNLDSWTNIGDDKSAAFSGTADYTITFDMDTTKQADWLLDLGQVHESAVVEINGKEIASLISYPYQCVIPADLTKEKNELKISVTNLMANHMAYIDKQSPGWKKFYNINFPSRLAENRGKDGLFTAENWQPRESGIVGPVTITPAKRRSFK